MNSSDTLSVAYGTARTIMPDGTEVPSLARKIQRGDGTVGWIIIDDRTLELERSFQNDTFRPSDHLPPDTKVLDRKPSALDGTTERVVHADLVMFLGDPDRILAQKSLDSDRIEHMRKHPASLTMARRLCQLSGPTWQQVMQYLPKYFPDSKV